MRQIAGVNLYTVSETAEELGVTPQTVRAYVKTGKLKGERVGRPILITETSIKTLLKGSPNGKRQEPQSEEERLEQITDLIARLEDESRDRLLFYLFKKYELQRKTVAEGKP